MDYLYDGSFEGLLTVIYEIYYSRTEPQTICNSGRYQQSLLSGAINIPTDKCKADKVSNAVRCKISSEALENCYNTCLSELEHCEMWIYRYLRLGFIVGSTLDNRITDDRVKKVLDTSSKVSRERHRMLGLLRFSLIGPDTYFSPMEPLYNIVAVLAPHFALRFKDQNWVIYDVKRKLAAVYDKKDWFIECGVDLNEYVGQNNIEELYQNLWRLYFKNISIRSRENPRCQKNFMPIRYWKYLPEKQLPLNSTKLVLDK